MVLPGRRPVRLGSNPTAMAAGAGALWVASEEAGTVTRIEPRTGTVVRAIPVGNGPSAVATGEGAVWVVNGHDGTVSRIDPATNAVSGTVRVGGEPTAVAAGGGAVWVAGGEDGTVARVDPRDDRGGRADPHREQPIGGHGRGRPRVGGGGGAAGHAPRRHASRPRPLEPSEAALDRLGDRVRL